MAQLTQTKLAGVHSHVNRLSEVPEGALARAQNAVLDRESLIEPRRGLPYYSTVIGSPGDVWRRLVAYGGRLIAHVGTTLYKDDGSGTFSSFSGTLTEPASGFRVRDVQAGGSLFLTSATGLKELDSVANNPQQAGFPGPLDSSFTLSGTDGFLADDAAVAYRAVLYRMNASGREIVSTPSQRLIAINEAGGPRNVAIQWYLPSDVSTSIFYRVYRSEQTAAPDDNPSDEMQLVREARLTSTDVSNGYIQVTDSQPDDLRGATLYTSPSEEGIAEGNDQPPLAYDVCEFRDHLIYANIRNRQRYLTELIGVGDSLTIFSAGVRYRTFSGTTTNGSPLVTGAVGEILFLRVGMKMKAAAGIPATARIQSLALVAGPLTQVTMTVNATASGARSVEAQDIVGIAGLEYFAASAEAAGSREFLAATAGTPSENIEATSRSIVRVVNADASSTVYAFYDSDGETTQRGLLRFQERAIGGAAFAFFSTAIDAFSPSPPSSGATELSANDEATNGYAWSKPERYEAVPIKNRGRRGSTPFKRCIALRDAVYLLSDQIYRLTGQSAPFDVQLFDTTTKLIAPESAVTVGDAIYCMSTQGVVRITEAGVQIASQQIERDLIRATTLTGFADKAFAVGYESDRAYTLWVPQESSDTVPTMYWRFNLFTQQWTHGDVRASCGVVDPVVDRMVVAEDTASRARRERKSFDRTDYADAEFAVTIASSLGVLVVVNSTTGIQDNDLLVQGANESRIVDVVNGTTLQVTDTISWSAAAATAYRPILVTIDPVPVALGNAGIMKKFTEVAALFRDAEFARFTIGFGNNFLPDLDAYVVSLETDDTATQWGVQPWGSDPQDEQPVRTYVPREVQIGHWLLMSMSFSICRETMALAGISFKARELSARFQGAGR